MTSSPTDMQSFTFSSNDNSLGLGLKNILISYELSKFALVKLEDESDCY